ncbi:Inversin-B [Chlorella vulgaris]
MAGEVGRVLKLPDGCFKARGDPLTAAGGCKLGDAVLADLVEQLSACAADVTAGDWQGALPVHRAAGFGHPPTCQLLLDAAPETITAADLYGKLPLHWAAEKGHAATCHLLLDAAPETSYAADQCGKLPLHWAAGFGHTATCQLLLDAAPETITVADLYGMLPVHWAAERGHTATCQLLLDASPETIHAADQYGKLPVHCASKTGQTVTCQLLLDRAPQAAAMPDFLRRIPLELALAEISPHLDAARCLVAAAPVASVLAFLSAVSQAQPLFADFFITRSPHLTSEEWTAAWSAVPAPCPGLLRALPAVLAHSTEQARHLVQHLSPADVQRLRTAALCMARAQRQSGVFLPTAVVWQILQQIAA